jgi:hypothetical protein
MTDVDNTKANTRGGLCGGNVEHLSSNQRRCGGVKMPGCIHGATYITEMGEIAAYSIVGPRREHSPKLGPPSPILPK